MHSTRKHEKRQKHYVCCCTENYVNNRESVNTQAQKQLRAALLLEEDYVSFIRNDFFKTFRKITEMHFVAKMRGGNIINYLNLF